MRTFQVIPIAFSISFLAASANAFPIPYRTLRYEGVVGQTEWYTCGPAAVATLLTQFYNLKTSETEILKLSLDAMAGTGKDPTKGGMTALALKQALSKKGIPAKGIQITSKALTDYFDAGGLPIILHVTKPQLHYVLAIGMVKDRVILADPSFGRRILPMSTLVEEKGFNGVTLVPIPPPTLVSYIREQQSKTLRWAENRLERLSTLRQRL